MDDKPLPFKVGDIIKATNIREDVRRRHMFRDDETFRITESGRSEPRTPKLLRYTLAHAETGEHCGYVWSDDLTIGEEA